MPRNPSAVAPYFSLARAAWIPYALAWDPETGAFRGVEGPRGFDTYREAVEAVDSLGSTAAGAVLCSDLRGVSLHGRENH
jgi:hypothetical protein